MVIKLPASQTSFFKFENIKNSIILVLQRVTCHCKMDLPSFTLRPRVYNPFNEDEYKKESIKGKIDQLHVKGYNL